MLREGGRGQGAGGRGGQGRKGGGADGWASTAPGSDCGRPGGYPFQAKKVGRRVVLGWEDLEGGCLFSQPIHLRPEASAD